MKSFIVPIIAVLFAIGIGAGFALLSIRQSVSEIPIPAYHEHADFAVFLNGEQVDFSLGEFMSTAPCIVQEPQNKRIAYAHGNDLDDAVHLHDGVGSVVHTHRPGVSWHDLFESIGMTFEDDVFIDHLGNEFRENEENNFRFIKNGEEVETLQDIEIRDLDRILISFGPRDRSFTELLAEYGQVTNDACFYSESCPHRGVAPYESCGGPDAYVKPPLLDWIGV